MKKEFSYAEMFRSNIFLLNTPGYPLDTKITFYVRTTCHFYNIVICVVAVAALIPKLPSC